MLVKSEVVTKPILTKDQKNIQTVQIFWIDLKQTLEIYSAAGLCFAEPQAIDDEILTLANTSKPNEPASHIPPAASENDPLHGVKIPCFGDQLNRV